ncbi:MAG: hypothetical protein J1E83_13685 [Lachnospiraceae bacterium]|nr:hypothetical protein [Lachnospiraceae bacterium]
MSSKSALTVNQIAGRICDRDGNLYSKKVVYEILNMYIEECRKGLLRGERILLTGIGTIIPEVKTHEHFNLPVCNKEDGNPPYTRMRMTRTYSLGQEMNRKLHKNIKNGILGLEELPFSKQQMAILKNSGMIPNEENEGK